MHGWVFEPERDSILRNGLLAGAAGALAVNTLGTASTGGSGGDANVGTDGSIEARLDRIEALLDRRTLASAPSLEGAGPAPAASRRAAPAC